MPAIDIEPNGDFLIVWAQASSVRGIFGQRFSVDGSRQATEFQVDNPGTFFQAFPAVGIDADGDFVVAWHNSSQDGSGYGVFARRFDSTGAAQGSEFGVNAVTSGDQRSAAIAVDADGDFVVSWQSFLQDGSAEGVFARRFKASGIAQSGDLPVNTFTNDVQNRPSIAGKADGDFVVAWNSAGQDGSSSGIFAQRFEVPALLDIDGDGSYAALTDGLLLLRYGFGFTGNTLIAGAVAQACTRCDSPAIVAYIQSLL
jgi:hypothetical protein